mgnify:FL=1
MERTVFPVDVLCLCNADGRIQPLRVRMEDEEKQLRCLDIAQVLNTREVNFVGIEARIYLCRAETRGSSWLFELQYKIRSHSWTLLRWRP